MRRRRGKSSVMNWISRRRLLALAAVDGSCNQSPSSSSPSSNKNGDIAFSCSSSSSVVSLSLSESKLVVLAARVGSGMVKDKEAGKMISLMDLFFMTDVFTFDYPAARRATEKVG